MGGPSGTYKLGGYYDLKEFPDSAGGTPHQGDYSIYFIADQELWHPAENAGRALTFFARVGGASSDRNTVLFSSGVQCGRWRPSVNVEF